MPKKVMVCCRGKNPRGRPTGRSEDAVWRYAEDFLHTHSTSMQQQERQQIEELRLGSQWPEQRTTMMMMMMTMMTTTIIS